METIKKNDFIALRYTGYANGDLFDSNEEENLKKIDSKAEAKEIIVSVGKKMLVEGFDKALEGKEIGKKYEVILKPKEAFGQRRQDLIKTIPLKVFTEKSVQPYPGLVLNMDNMLAKIIAVSGARVITDFNNPLSGKDIKYVFTITRKVEDEKEKAEALFKIFFKFVPEYEIKEKIIVKGPQILEEYIKVFSSQFKEMMNKELSFELKEIKKEEDKKANSSQETALESANHSL